jgi:hypothetical protein
MLVISSTFGGVAGRRHPFHARARALEDETDVKLVYLPADLLARTATAIEMRGLSPRQRETLAWNEVLAKGLIEQTQIIEELVR